MAAFPCFIFSDDGKLCDIKGIPKKSPQYSARGRLEERFLKSLRGDLRDFLYFCSLSRNPEQPEYRIFALHQFPEFRYAFCEKNLLRGTELNFVFLSNDMTEFYGFLSPSTFYFQNLSGRLVYELLYMKSVRFYDYSSLTPEAFLLVTHVPHLAENLFPNRCGARYCNLVLLTETILRQFSTYPPYCGWMPEISVQFHGQKEEFSRSSFLFTRNSASILEFSTPAYGCLLYALMHIFYTIGEQTALNIDFYDTAADVTITTTTFRFSRNPGLDESLNALRYLPAECGNMAEIAFVIGELADIRQSMNYDPATGLLRLTLGLGYGHQFKADYKFSDPYYAVIPVVLDIHTLVQMYLDEAGEA